MEQVLKEINTYVGHQELGHYYGQLDDLDGYLNNQS